MKICLLSPYIPKHTGGGEKYLFDVATALVKKHKVFVAISSNQPLTSLQTQQIRDKYQQFLDTDLSQIEFIATPIFTQTNILKKLWWTRQFGSLFYLTDGSIFFSLAKLNVLHIQFPLKIDKSSWLEQQKLKCWQIKTTNSEFTRQIVEASWPVDISLVHQPMVDTEQIGAGTNLNNKQKIILNVGRFFSHLHSKRQDVLVDIFRQLRKRYKKDLQDWQLVLIGNVEDQSYADKVKAMARGLPIKILHQVSRPELINWLQKSSIYWHATGYRINPTTEPEKVEHFGITTVEAMAAGNVPLVVGKGGQLEVVGSELEDWTWLSKRDCVRKTRRLIRDQNLRENLQKKAIQQAKQFSPDSFLHKTELIFSQAK